MFVMILICVLELLCFRASLNVYECVSEFFLGVCMCGCMYGCVCMGVSVCALVWVRVNACL